MAKVNTQSAINIVLTYIKANVDERATVSRKTGEPIIHYTVANGQDFVKQRTGESTPFRKLYKLDGAKALEICNDLDLTNDDRI